LSRRPTSQHQAESGYQHRQEKEALNLRLHQAVAFEQVDVIPSPTIVNEKSNTLTHLSVTFHS